MLAKDTEMIQRHGEAEVVERTQEQTKQAIEQRIANETRGTDADAGMDVTDKDQRWGRAMDVKDVMRYLKAMNQQLTFEESRNFPGLMGIYITEWERDPNTGGLSHNRRYVMAMENGMMPEFSIVNTETISLPNPNSHEAGDMWRVKQFDSLTRGWRGVLVRLLHEGIITAGQIQQHFKVTQGRESRIWHQETGQETKIEVKG